jgi:hypothetical protein
MSEEIRFNSKIDLWLLVGLLAIVAVCLWVLIDQFSAIWSRGPLIAVLWLVPLILGIELPLWFLLTVRYFLSDEALRIRCGPFHLRVPLADIKTIKSTNSVSVSPALSLDALRIEYGQGRAVTIAPEPREEFLRQIDYRRRQLG